MSEPKLEKSPSRIAFEQWYTVNAFNYASNPLGSRDCSLQWIAWHARDAEVATLQRELAEAKAESDSWRRVLETMTAERDSALSDNDEYHAENNRLLGEHNSLRAQLAHAQSCEKSMRAAELEAEKSYAVLTYLTELRSFGKVQVQVWREAIETPEEHTSAHFETVRPDQLIDELNELIGTPEPKGGERSVEDQVRDDMMIYGAGYMRIDSDGTKTRLHPSTVMVDAQPDQETGRCMSCDGTGDVHRADGEWLGRCTCPAGQSPAKLGGSDNG